MHSLNMIAGTESFKFAPLPNLQINWTGYRRVEFSGSDGAVCFRGGLRRFSSKVPPGEAAAQVWADSQPK